MASTYRPIVCVLFLLLAAVQAADGQCEENKTATETNEKCRKFRDESGRLTMRCGVEDGLSAFPDVDPSVEVLILAGNRTNLYKSFSSDSFKNLTSIVELNLNRTSLDSLYHDGFENSKNLTKLDLSHNYIDAIDPDAWNGLTNLRELNLSNNILRYLPSRRFKSLPDLEVLDLSHTQITRVDSGLLGGLKNLRKLRISGNRMFAVRQSALDSDQQLDHLKFLDLTRNNLGNTVEDLDSGFFARAPNLEVLDLRYNIINELKDDHFQNLTRLRIVHLSSANLKRLGANVFHWPTLEYLDLSHNSLESLPNFGRSSNLRYLDLSNNRLTMIGENAFTSLDLNYLDLSSNRLTTISSSAFQSSKVKQFKLADNRDLNISSVREALSGWMDLSELDLSACSIKDSDLLDEPFRNLGYKLKKLNLASNELTDLPKLTKFKYIEELDFRFNQIKTYRSLFHEGEISIRL